MPTQLQLDGPDLEGLLARVRDELGPGARIISAEKVRSGGLAGFFARERYEIRVETDDDQPGPVTPPLPPTSLLDLADAVSDEELQAVSTESTSFGDVLRQLTRDGGATAAVPAPRAASQSWRGTAAAPAAAAPPATAPTATVPAAAAPAAAGRAGAEPAAGSVQPWTPPPSGPSTGRQAAASLAPTASAPAGQAAAVQAPAVPSPASPSASAQLAAARPSHPAAPDAWAPATVEAAPVVWSPPATTPPVHAASALATRPRSSLTVSSRPADDRAVTALSLLGLPDHLLPTPSPDGLRAALLTSLLELPEAEPVSNAPGQVLAVVGPGALALAVALQVLDELDVDPAKALLHAGARPAGVPAERVLATPAAAARRRTAWRTRRTIGVLVIDAPITAAGAVRAAEFLEALSPTAVWGVVEASRKPADVCRWAEFMGGVDALAVQEVESSGDPASVLSLGVPISRLGHDPSSPEAWAALLTSRSAA